MHCDRVVKGDDATNAAIFCSFADVADLFFDGNGLVIQPEAEPVIDPAHDRVEGGMWRV